MFGFFPFYVLKYRKSNVSYYFFGWEVPAKYTEEYTSSDAHNDFYNTFYDLQPYWICQQIKSSLLVYSF